MERGTGMELPQVERGPGMELPVQVQVQVERAQGGSCPMARRCGSLAGGPPLTDISVALTTLALP